jgi:WD40 repeat protein
MDVAMSADGRFLATADIEGQVNLWNRSGQQVGQFQQSERILSLAFSPDGTQILTGGGDGAKVWLIDQTGQVLKEEVLERPGFTRYRTLQVGFSADGQYMLTAGDRTIQIWDSQTYDLVDELSQHQSAINALAVFPGQSVIASAGDDSVVKLWDLAHLNRTILQPSQRELLGAAVRFLDQQQVIATFDNDIRVLPRAGSSSASTNLPETQPTQTVVDIDISPDGQLLATVSYDDLRGAYVQLRDRATGRVRHSWQPHQGRMAKARFSPDGRVVATAGFNGVKVHDLSGELQQRWSTPNRVATSLEFSPNGRYIIAVFDDGQLERWDRQTGERVNQVEAHDGWIIALSVSSNGLIATAGEDGRTKLWSPAGEPRHEIDSHIGIVRDVQFSPDGTILATAGDDEHLRIWWLQSRSNGIEDYLLAEFSLRRSVKGIDFSPDGRKIASITDMGEVLQWLVPLSPDRGDPVAAACDRLGLYFQTHPEEREKLTICANTPQ